MESALLVSGMAGRLTYDEADTWLLVVWQAAQVSPRLGGRLGEG
jgi:hypothetical protein